MAGVQVSFGANIAPLVDGIDSIRDKLTHLGEILGVAFSVEGIKNFVESMATLGSQSATVAAQLGVSNQQVVTLSGYAALGGESTAQFATEFERLTLNVQRSTRDALNPTAQALHVLGLNARDLIGLPADQYFDKLAEAASRFNPSLNLTNALMQVGGRQAVALLPILLQGKEHLEEFQQGWEKASEGLAAAIPGMDQTHEKLLLLDQSATSFGARIFSVLKPAIDGAIGWVTRWLESMDSAKIKAFATAAISDIETATVAISAFFLGAGETASDFEKTLDSVLSKLKAIGIGAAVGGLAGAAFGGPAGAAGGAILGGMAGYSLAGASDAPSDYGTIPGMEMVPPGAFDQPAAAVAQGGAKVVAAVTTQKDTVGTKIKDFFDTIKAAIASGNASLGKISLGGGLNAGATNEAGAQAVAAMQSHYATMIKQIDDYFASTKERLSADLAAHRLTYDQESQALIAAIRQRDTSEQTWYDSEIALVKAGGKNFEAIEKEKVAAHDKAMLDIQKATDAAAKQDAKDWQSALKPLESAWNSQLRSMLAGTETFSQAMKKIFADLAIQAIEKLESIGVEKLAGGLASAFGGGPSSLLGGAGQAATTMANTSALTLLTTAISANTLALGGSAAAGAAGAPLNLLSGAGGAAGGTSLLSTLFTPFKSLFSLFGLPFFAAGTDYVMRGGLGVLHPGETIIPAAQGSGPFTGAGMGGDTHVHNWNISAVDGSSVQRWLGRGGARQIANAVAGVQKITPSMSW